MTTTTRLAAQAFFNGEFVDARRMAPAERKTILLKLADLIDRNAADPPTLTQIDAGKPIVDCEDVDVVDTVNTLRWYAEATDRRHFGKRRGTV